MEQRTVRKTVVIGLGGTGRDVVLQLKRKYREVYGRVDIPSTRFVVFDTADQKPLLVPGEKPIELTPAEFLRLTVSHPGRAVKVNEEIDPWFPDERGIPMVSISKGAGQVRVLGRLALYCNARTVYDRIRRALDSVNSLRPHQDLGGFRVSNDSSVQIIVVGSLSGGTGSGTFLDIAYVCRNHMRHGTDDLSAYLLLPDVFSTLTATANVEPNAYAALKELDLLMDAEYGRKETSVSFGGNEISWQGRPFDAVYLVNKRNQRGQVYETVEELTKVIAMGIFVATGATGQDADDVRDNLQHQLTGTVFGKGLKYSSFGVSELVLDSDGRVEEEARRVAAATLEAVFGGRAPEVGSDVDLFLSGLELTDKLADRVLLDEAPPSISGDNARIETLDALITNGDKNVRDVQAAVERVRGGLALDFADSFDAERLKRLASASGVLGTARFLQVSVERLKELQDHFAAAASKAGKEGREARQRADGQRAEVPKVKKAWFGRQRKAQGLARSFAAAVKKAASSAWDQARFQKAEEVVAAVLQEVRQHSQNLEDLRDKVLPLANDLRQRSVPKERVEPFTVRMPCPTAADSVQDNPAPSEFFEWLRDEGRKVHDLLDMRREELLNVFLGFARSRKSVQALTTMEMSSAWEACPEEDKHRYIKHLEELASPLWEYEVEYMGGDKSTAMLQIMGVPHAELTLEDVLPRSSQAGRSVHLATTGDERRIYCYRVEAAIPAFILSGIRNYRARFERMCGETFFHIDLRWEDIPDLCPDGYPDLTPSTSTNGTGPHGAGKSPITAVGGAEVQMPIRDRIDTRMIPLTPAAEANGNGGATEPTAAPRPTELAGEAGEGLSS
jgi:hypothetical protein